jgi:hypothetical protein
MQLTLKIHTYQSQEGGTFALSMTNIPPSTEPTSKSSVKHQDA